MTHLFLQLQHFLLRQSRRSLLVIAVSVSLLLIGSWQLAFGIIGQIQDNSRPSVEAPRAGQSTTGQESSKPNADSTPLKQDDAKKSDDTTVSPNADKQNGTPGPATTNKPGSSSGGNTAPGNSTPTIPVVTRNSLGIPLSATVLSLSGLNYNLYNNMPQKFQGIFSQSPYTMKKVEYPASLASDSITKGVAALNTQLRTTPGPKIVLAQSQGAQVASRWMRQYANDASAPGASDITFLLTGNPLRSTGGYIIGRAEVGGTIGQPTPTNTKWPIIDFARRYDGWADWVHNQGNQWAVDNANAGKSTMHNDYQTVNLYASTHTIWKSGNTTYVLTKEDNLPLWDNNNEYPLGVRAAMRAHIERGYNRPANDPKVQLLPIETPAWEAQLQDWGVPF